MKTKNKKAESSIGTAISVLISVVLGGLVLTSVIMLIDKNVSPSMEKTFSDQQINVSRVVEEETVYVPGDINKDGLVNETDYIYFANFIAGIDGYYSPTTDVGDLNGDKKVNSDDLALLRDKINSSELQTFASEDVNKDGVVNKDDVDLLERCVAGWDGYDDSDISVYDINGDGSVNDSDIDALKDYLALNGSN